MLYCPKCYATSGRCPECGKSFVHGTASKCDATACIEVNAPIDCRCGRVVSSSTVSGVKGVLDFDSTFLPFLQS